MDHTNVATGGTTVGVWGTIIGISSIKYMNWPRENIAIRGCPVGAAGNIRHTVAVVLWVFSKIGCHQAALTHWHISVYVIWYPLVCHYQSSDHRKFVEHNPFIGIMFLFMVTRCCKLARNSVEQSEHGTWRDMLGLRTALPLVQVLIRDGCLYFLM
jgi:hypothetical protein